MTVGRIKVSWLEVEGGAGIRAAIILKHQETQSECIYFFGLHWEMTGHHKAFLEVSKGEVIQQT